MALVSAGTGFSEEIIETILRLRPNPTSKPMNNPETKPVI
jgi:hypothetical protein